MLHTYLYFQQNLGTKTASRSFPARQIQPSEPVVPSALLAPVAEDSDVQNQWHTEEKQGMEKTATITIHAVSGPGSVL